MAPRGRPESRGGLRGRHTAIALAAAIVLALTVGSALAPAPRRVLLAAAFSAGGSGCTGGDPPALAAAGAAAVQAAAGLDDLVEAVDTFKDLVGSHGRELEHLWRGRLERLPEQGIVCAAGSPYTLANAFVSLHVLRHHLRCKLPATVM